MKVVDYVCDQCDGRGELLIAGQCVMPDDLVDEPAAEWIVFDAEGQLRCKECGGLVRIEGWKTNGSKVYMSNACDCSGEIKS